MAKPAPLQNQFNAGMKRDSSRNRMAPNSAWNMVDLIPDYDAPARERGGWAHASASVSAVTGTASYIRGGIFAAFSPTAGEVRKNLCIDEDGLLYSVATDGTVTLIGSARTLAQNPVFHGGTAASAASAIYTGLVIIPDGTGAAVPKKYDGTTLADLNGSPPMARFATVYRDYTVLGNGTVSSTTHPNRIWFSPAGDPDAGFSGSQTAWDTEDSWIDFSLPVKGLASTKSALLVFHSDRISRIRGSSPPPDEDMVVDDPFQKVGLLDPFSITEDQDMVYWCAPEGVFRTDGVSLDDISLKGGMLRYWLDLAADATTAWTFATGIHRGNLIVSVMNGSTFVDAFLISLNNYAWYRLSNLDAVSFWDGLLNNSDEEFFARRSQAFVGRCETMFDPGNSSYKADANGTAVASVLETPFYEFGRPGIKTLKALYAGFYMSDHGSDNPTLAVSYVKTPEATDYTALGTLSENASYDRRRIQIGGRVWGAAFKFQRANAGDFHGYDLSAEIGYQEESKRMS
jgi:hypothetical protein